MAAAYRRPAAGHDFLLEVRFAEAVTSPLVPGMRRLGHRLFEELMSRGIGLAEIRSGLAPGRAALAVLDLPPREPEQEVRRWGPLVKEAIVAGRPSPELEAFAREAGRPLSELERIFTEKGHRFAAVEVLPGRPVGLAVAELLAEILNELRQGAGLPEMSALLALASGEPAPFTVAGLVAGGETVGGDGQPFRPRSVDDYFSELRRRGVALESLGVLQERLREGRA